MTGTDAVASLSLNRHADAVRRRTRRADTACVACLPRSAQFFDSLFALFRRPSARSHVSYRTSTRIAHAA
ncbi:hypothetical protein WM40_00450 [Robbsia andropogonis]|uniref:Uncharacterized protein n=1 Tax=Robbsia andropogonis TaxID=28092 RepID=A0A0F5K501_9BURK|nr:hypothetical protein WM40_00450 [Robbsia andropogonis]